MVRYNEELSADMGRFYTDVEFTAARLQGDEDCGIPEKVRREVGKRLISLLDNFADQIEKAAEELRHYEGE